MHDAYKEGEEWIPPSENEIPSDSEGDLIRYGRELIVNTSKYLGPNGVIAQRSNNTNCQNCHLNAGRANFANPFSAVASSYPRFRERSGRLESIEFRVNECMQRSMNGFALDSLDPEMRAMVAYLKWVGKDVPQGVRPKGSGTQELPFLNRAADPVKGASVYEQHCVRCHGSNGQGIINQHANGYVYPPLWGEGSYNTSAGIYRLSKLAGFIKNNMPFEEANWKNPLLSDDEAWDVAAFISAQRRPVKPFHYDWPDISKKPVDYPFGPYRDSFSESQHKYGPFNPIKNAKAGSESSTTKSTPG